MLGRKPIKKSPQGAKGKGAAAAKQLGLFVDFNPEEMMQSMDDDDVDDGDLEAELAALTGKKTTAAKPKPKGKSPLPMDHIAKMAEDCMRDIDDEEEDGDEDMEEDEDLLAELQEVVGEDEDESEITSMGEENGSDPHHDEVANREKPVATEQLLTSPVVPQKLNAQDAMAPVVGELQQTLHSRIENYKMAIGNAREAGDASKVRRFERGLKTLENMLSAARKGKKINEEEIPPPVASGKSTLLILQQPVVSESEGEESKPEATSEKEIDTNNSGEAMHNLILACSQSNDEDEHAPKTDDRSTDSRALLVARQKEYKMAALKAKQQGNIEKAKEYMKTGKKFDVIIEALDNGQPVDLRNMPPSPEEPETVDKAQSSSAKTEIPSEEHAHPSVTTTSSGPKESGVPQQPTTVQEALQQRMERYKSAAEQAKASGDERKARMHERIAKQYQDAIRAQKAGRKVNFEELPIPPGFPPIPGMEHSESESTIAGVLEAASKLANAEVKENEDDDEEDEIGTAELPPVAKKPAKLPERPTQVVKPLIVPPAADRSQLTPEEIKKTLPATSPIKSSSTELLSSAAREQLEFLENRKKQYLKAAVQAKQKNDLDQAKLYLKTAKSFDPSIELVKCGKSIDISKLPSPPTDDESEFIFVHHNDVKISQKSEEVYAQLLKLLKEQHEKCMQYARQFTHMGNVTETTRFEKLAQNCKKNVEILQLAQAQGLDPPPHHFEEKTFKIVRIFAELNSTEMLLIIVKGINLPSPPGVATNDLDAFVKFEFHYPSAEQAQKNKTTVIKNTNCPEYDQHFKLNINRNHRGFKRVIQAKGIKFEIYHKGSFFFRSDKLVGTAQLKLDRLESECEIREIIEIFDGRKPTGGKLEVKVRLREPLSGQDLQTVTESWLVLEQSVSTVGNS